MTVHSSVTPTLVSRTKHRVIAERTAIDCAQIEAALRERPQASDRDRLRDRMVRLVVLRTFLRRTASFTGRRGGATRQDDHPVQNCRQRGWTLEARNDEGRLGLPRAAFRASETR